jgi:hypothetical protein
MCPTINTGFDSKEVNTRQAFPACGCGTTTNTLLLFNSITKRD